jgi:TRAP-type C4-dicarboxylate transport system substrate-binding protein
MRRVLLLCACLLAACGGDEPRQSRLGAPVQSAAKKTLTMGVTDAALFDSVGLRVFVDEVERRSRGRLKIKVTGLGVEKEPKLPDMVRRGKYDLTWAKARRFPDLPALSTIAMPMLVDDYALQTALFERGFHDELLKSLEDVGLRGIAILPDWFGRPVSRSRPLASPADWERVDGFAGPATPLRTRALKAMGVRRVVDSSVYGPSPIFVRDEAEAGEQLVLGLVSNYLGSFGVYVTTNVATTGRALMILGNPQTMDRLSDEEREWIAQAGRAGARRAIREAQDTESGFLEEACRTTAIRAVEAGDADVEALRARVMKVYREVEDEGFRKALETIEATRRETPAAPIELPAACRGPLPARALPVRRSTAPAALNGEYRYSTTAAQYEKLGLDDVNAKDLAGTYTVRLRDGRGTSRRRSAKTTLGPAPEPPEMTYRVDGDRVTFLTPDQPITVNWKRLDDGSLRFDSETTLDPTVAPAFAAVWKRLR